MPKPSPQSSSPAPVPPARELPWPLLAAAVAGGAIGGWAAANAGSLFARRPEPATPAPVAVAPAAPIDAMEQGIRSLSRRAAIGLGAALLASVLLLAALLAAQLRQRERIARMLREREAMGLDEITLLPAMDTARRNLRDFADAVIARY